MLLRLWVLSRVALRAFRAPVLVFLLLLLYPLYWLWISLGLGLDRLFYRQQHTSPITLVVGGPPRSGTTFLHRYLVNISGGRGTQLWEALVPSLTWQRLFRPVLRRALARGVPRIDLGPAHVAGLDLPEADDISVFARYLDSFFYYVYALSWDTAEHSSYITPALRPATVAKRDLRWLRRAARRNRINGDTSLAILKSFSVGFALGTAHSVLEQPRVIYVSRAPHETLPSSLSMVSRVLGAAGIYERIEDDARRRHVDRIVRASLMLQTAAIADLRRLPPDTVLIVRYEDLIDNFAQTMQRILHFAGVDISGDIATALQERDALQRSRRSEHQYSLQEFGLSEETIREQFAEVYRYFSH